MNTIGVGIGGGVVYFPSPKFGLEFGLGNVLGLSMSSMKNENAGVTTTSSAMNVDLFDFSTVSLDFGVAYYFNRGEEK